MNTSIRVSLLAAAAVLFLAVATFFASSVNASHSWGGYHWDKQTPFTLQLGDNTNPAWDLYLAEAVADWQPSVVLDTVIVPGGTNATRGKNTPKNCVPTSGRVEVCNALYGNTGWLGIASIWVSGTHITAGTVKVNDSYFRTSTYNKADWKALVMCQEVAHVFGLAHQDEVFINTNLGSCMDYTNAPSGGLVNGFDFGPSNRWPNAHDFAQLEIIYGHSDTSVAPTTIAALDDSNDPSAWGKETHRTRDGRHSTFEKDLGNGNKVIRDVFWAESRSHHDHE
jgi:hypothetical protein